MRRLRGRFGAACGSTSGANRLKQDSVPMKIEELLLAAGEPSHIDDPCRVDAHAFKRGTMSNRGDYELAIVLKADEATIEEMINAWSQEQSILAVQSLLVRRVPPGLAVTGDEVHGVLNAGDAAAGFNPGHPFSEQALSIPGPDK